MTITNKDAIRIAKDYISFVFAEENISDIGLEEIRRGNKSNWEITVGFTRPWQLDKLLPGFSKPLRSYKVITIGCKSGEVLSMTDADRVIS